VLLSKLLNPIMPITPVLGCLHRPKRNIT